MARALGVRVDAVRRNHHSSIRLTSATSAPGGAAPCLCSTGRFSRYTDPERRNKGSWKGSFGRCIRNERYAGTAALSVLDNTLDDENASSSTHYTGQKIGIGRRDLLIAGQRHCSARAEPRIGPGRAGYRLTTSGGDVGMMVRPRTSRGRRWDNGPMTKSELIQRIAQTQSHLVERDVALAVNMMLEHMTGCLSRGGRIEIRGFGSFSIRFRRARVGRNPRTGTPVSLPARFAPYFKPGKGLRERLNRRRWTSRSSSNRQVQSSS